MRLELLKPLLTLLLLTAMPAYAAEGGGGYSNLIFGLSVPDSANTDTHTVYGFNGGSRVTKLFSIGGYHAVSNEQDGPGSSPFSYTLTGIESRVYMSSGDKDVFVGLRAGITKVNSAASGLDVTFSPYHYGLVSGYNFKIWSFLSVGFEGSFLEVEEASSLSGSTRVFYKSFHTINFFGTIGFMF